MVVNCFQISIFAYHKQYAQASVFGEERVGEVEHVARTDGHGLQPSDASVDEHEGVVHGIIAGQSGEPEPEHQRFQHHSGDRLHRLHQGSGAPGLRRVGAGPQRLSR